MSINYALVKTSLYNWAVSQVPLGMPVIFWQQNAPRPTVAYVTLFLNNFIAVNQDWADDSTDNLGVVNMKGDRNFTLSINAYGGSDPLTLLENMRSSLQKDSVLNLLRVDGLAFYQSSSINDLSDLIDSQFEKRAQMDVIFGIGQKYTDNNGYFNMIQITETIFDYDNTILYTEIINIP